MMQDFMPVSPSDLVRSARAHMGKTQAEFARDMGSKQSLVSKYERGRIDPPAALIIRCMTILESPVEETISADALADMVRTKLAGPRNATARTTFAALVSGLVRRR